MVLENIFLLNDNDEPICNPEIRHLTYIKDIYIRDKGVTLVRDGKTIRVKKVAVKELAYVYYKLNKKFFNNYSEKDRDNEILRKLDLKDYVLTDELIQKALTELREDITIVEEKLINVIEENLHDQIEMFKQIGISNRAALEFLKNTPIETQMGEAVQQRRELVDSVKSDFNETLRATKDLSLAITELKKLRIDLQQAERKEGKTENRLETNSDFYIKKEIRL